MRISDWSSDVCSSDHLSALYSGALRRHGVARPCGGGAREPLCPEADSAALWTGIRPVSGHSFHPDMGWHSRSNVLCARSLAAGRRPADVRIILYHGRPGYETNADHSIPTI